MNGIPHSSNSIEQLETLIELAKDIGYEVRHEVLGGSGGGTCEFGNRKCLFVDLSLSVLDQLDCVGRALANDPQLALYIMTDQQETALRSRRAA